MICSAWGFSHPQRQLRAVPEPAPKQPKHIPWFCKLQVPFLNAWVCVGSGDRGESSVTGVASSTGGQSTRAAAAGPSTSGEAKGDTAVHCGFLLRQAGCWWAQQLHTDRSVQELLTPQAMLAAWLLQSRLCCAAIRWCETTPPSWCIPALASSRSLCRT